MAKKSKFRMEVIEEKSVSRSDDAAIRRLLAGCFSKGDPFFSKFRNWHSDPEYILISRKGREIIGHVAIVVREISCGRTKVKIAGIQSLALKPECRGTGLSQLFMTQSMAEAWRRGIEFGLLFCVSGLERFYASLGWRSRAVPFFMRDEFGLKKRIPPKNIGMILLLSGKPFPSGTIDLRGRDW
ncbi:MAG: GNAT family N-acetyltransferase [Kiritimatiellia bacterium]|nr:GNAT family N-acetyltransferase [Kiritimatiellia bacterium]